MEIFVNMVEMMTIGCDMYCHLTACDNRCNDCGVSDK